MLGLVLFWHPRSHFCQDIGRAACQSSSFWWPRFQTGEEDDYVYYGQYYFLNDTLYTNLDNRPRQWILIDVGDQEESEYTHVGYAYAHAVK